MTAAPRELPVTPVPGRMPDYAAMHRWLPALRGPAAACACAECGAPARCWCYDGSDPDEKRDPASDRRYSLDPDRYRPRCASCHRTIAAGRRPLTPDVIDQADTLYQTGASLTRIAARLGVTRPTVRAALAARGVAIRPPRSQATADVDSERAAVLYAAGASLRGIAAQLGVTRPAVRAALIREGVAIRPPGPTRRHLRRAATAAANTTAAADRPPRVTFQPFPTVSRQPSRPPTP